MSTVCATANRLRLEFGFVKGKKIYYIYFFLTIYLWYSCWGVCFLHLCHPTSFGYLKEKEKMNKKQKIRNKRGSRCEPIGLAYNIV